jgi:hypothetical protein
MKDRETPFYCDKSQSQPRGGKKNRVSADAGAGAVLGLTLFSLFSF